MQRFTYGKILDTAHWAAFYLNVCWPIVWLKELVERGVVVCLCGAGGQARTEDRARISLSCMLETLGQSARITNKYLFVVNQGPSITNVDQIFSLGPKCLMFDVNILIQKTWRLQSNHVVASWWPNVPALLALALRPGQSLMTIGHVVQAPNAVVAEAWQWVFTCCWTNCLEDLMFAFKCEI